MTDGSYYPGLPGSSPLAARLPPVIPVTRRLLADGETAVGVYRKLAGEAWHLPARVRRARPCWSRYSFIGVRSQATLTERDGEAVWLDDPPPGVPLSGDPLDVLRACAKALRAPRLRGHAAADGRARRLPRLRLRAPDREAAEPATDDLHLPELGLLLATDLAVLDHSDGSCLLVIERLPGRQRLSLAEAYADAVERLEQMTADAGQAGRARQSPSPAPWARSPSTRRTPEGEYAKAVDRALEAIRAGDIFQVQVGQRFEVTTDADPLDVYRMLRTSNPSPYMYLLRLAGTGAEQTGAGAATLDVVGSSPESLVTVTGAARPAAPDRRHPPARRHRREGCRPGRRTASATRRNAPST